MTGCLSKHAEEVLRRTSDIVHYLNREAAPIRRAIRYNIGDMILVRFDDTLAEVEITDIYGECRFPFDGKTGLSFWMHIVGKYPHSGIEGVVYSVGRLHLPVAEEDLTPELRPRARAGSPVSLVDLWNWYEEDRLRWALKESEARSNG